MFEGKRISEKVRHQQQIWVPSRKSAALQANEAKAVMEPELSMRHANVQIDVFSFGILLWEMLTGQLPWGELSSPMQAELPSASSPAIFNHGSRCIVQLCSGGPFPVESCCAAGDLCGGRPQKAAGYSEACPAGAENADHCVLARQCRLAASVLSSVSLDSGLALLCACG